MLLRMLSERTYSYPSDELIGHPANATGFFRLLQTPVSLSFPFSLAMSAEQEVNERKPLLERQGSGSEWSIRDAETLPGGSDSGRSTPTLSPATDGESWRPLIAIFAITAVQV